MGQPSESKLAEHRLRHLLSNAMSGKGLLVQAVTYQFAMPAIASPPPAIAAAAPIAPPDTNADVYIAPIAIPLAVSNTASLVGTTISPKEIKSPQQTETVAMTLVPQAALTASSSDPSLFHEPPLPQADLPQVALPQIEEEKDNATDTYHPIQNTEGHDSSSNPAPHIEQALPIPILESVLPKDAQETLQPAITSPLLSIAPVAPHDIDISVAPVALPIPNTALLVASASLPKGEKASQQTETFSITLVSQQAIPIASVSVPQSNQPPLPQVALPEAALPQVGPLPLDLPRLDLLQLSEGENQTTGTYHTIPNTAGHASANKLAPLIEQALLASIVENAIANTLESLAPLGEETDPEALEDLIKTGKEQYQTIAPSAINALITSRAREHDIRSIENPIGVGVSPALEVLAESEISENIGNIRRFEDASAVSRLNDIPIPPADSEFSWFSLEASMEKTTPKSQQLTARPQTDSSLLIAEEALPILIAGPQDFNPGLSNPSDSAPTQDDNGVPDFNNMPFNSDPAVSPDLPPSDERPQSPELPLETFPSSATPLPGTDTAVDEQPPFIEWTDLEIGLDSNSNNFGQSSWSVLPTVTGQLANGNLITVSSGFSQFEQTGIESVTHIPLTLGWQGSLDDLELRLSGGVDFFNRLPADTHANATATVPLSQDAQLSVNVEQGLYTENARTLENQISRWHYGLDFAWQISPEVNFFSTIRLGNYSDGNWEQSSYSRLEKQIGDEAAVALTLTNQSFRDNVENTSGYFSPSDFLVATAEMSWRQQISDSFGCGLLGSIGQQRLEGEWALAYRGQALCTVDITPALQFELGYQFNNVSNAQSALIGDNAYSNQQIIGGIRLQF